MLMPIVSMNKMAMNESVATTCCFHEVASATNVYWEVLNGGWIGSGFVEVKDWIKSGYKDWADALGYDVSGVLKDGTYRSLPSIAKFDGIWGVKVSGDDDPWNVVAGKWIDGAHAGTNAPLGLGDTAYIHYLGWFENNKDGFGMGSTCSHNSNDCVYLKYEIQHLNNRHWDAVKAHSGVSEWSKPHEAKRFHS